ncbi:MAG: hypothetical protein ACFFCS_12770 [Candidatus Hodarchaeota archaeon]
MGFLSLKELSQMDEKEIFTYANSTNIENWYQTLEEYTIPTRFITLDMGSVNAIVQAIEAKKSGKPIPSTVSGIIQELTGKIDVEVNSFGSAFVRLSMRSPKDSPVAIKKGKERYGDAIESATDEWEKNLLLVKSQKFGLKVSNGPEAMELLLTSTRILDDLKDCQKFGFLPGIIVREWMDIDENAEFRGFVDDRKLVGLSQYFYYCYFPGIIERKAIILEQITSFFNEIKNILPVSSCILDFALIDGKVIILELNPFFVGTDACLFSWKTDTFETFEFRLNEGK